MTRWQEVGDRIFRRRYRSLDLNVGVVLADEGLLVIDSRANHADADELRAELASLSSRPIRWLVNTHYHWDHSFGNAGFPEAVIVGHRRCRAVLLEDGERMKRDLAADERIPEDRRPAFLEVDITPPAVVFDDEITIHLGAREVRVVHFGIGHTDSDVAVFVDDACFAGDLVEEGAPPAFGDAFPRAWVKTLDLLVPHLEGVVVPGHGDLVDRGFVRAQRAEIAAAVAAVDGEGAAPYPDEVMATVRDRLTVESARRAG